MLEKVLTQRNITIAAIVLAAIFPLVLSIPYVQNLFVFILIFIIFASAWNLLAISGQGSLGHAAFFGIGGYASTIIALQSGLSPYITIFIGGAFAAIVGLLIGLTCVRLNEWFLAMVTFGFAIIVQTITVSFMAGITGGWDGISSPRLVSTSIPGYALIEYYSILVITILCILAIWYILKSKIGLAFAAIRENEQEARASGVDPVRYRLLAFAISAAIAGIAGALEIHHFGYITPEIFGVDISFWPIIYSIFGGLGTIAGPIIGTIVLSLFWDGLKGFSLTYERFVIIGVLLILTVIFLPKGLVSIPEKYKAWRERRAK